MPQKPAENMTVTVSWDKYKVLKDKAIGGNTNIKKILDKLVGDYLEGDRESAPVEKVYVCPECGEEWETKQQLRGHMRKHDEAGKTDEELEEFVKGLENVDVEDIREDS